MTDGYRKKQTALGWIATNSRWLSDFHLRIWDYAETAFREYRSAGAYVELLRNHGVASTGGHGQVGPLR